MKIAIVMGFFLPVPPEIGGATEKTWSRLAIELAARGHATTVISRQWPRWPARETLKGVSHLRVAGFDHRRRLWQNLILDFIWSWRVFRQLPESDIVVVHAVTLPVWLATFRRRAGRVVVMPGRMPKGQYRFYRGISRVLVTSTPVKERVLAENPRLAPVARICGYPIDWTALARPRAVRENSAPITIGFIGRLHPEKGINLLLDAILQLAALPDLPPWRLVLCGPSEIAAGGGGEPYRLGLEQKLRARLPAEQWSVRPPLFNAAALADLYRSLDIFCYPSLSAEGETFGVAVAEAMAAGAVPIISNLACFRDFVRPGVSGLTFDHQAVDAGRQLTDAIACLIRDPGRRQALATAAQAEVERFDYPRYADTLIEDFKSLLPGDRG